MYPNTKPHLKNLQVPFLFTDDSPALSSIHYSTKENCLSLSNQSESLLVSSLRASTSRNDQNNPNDSNNYTLNTRNGNSSLKKQKRLNSESFHHERNKTFDSIQSAPSFGKPHNLTITECLSHQPTHQQVISSPNTTCTSCTKELPLLKQQLETTTHRLQELEALVKICFSKNLAVEKSLSEKNQEILEVKIRQDEVERMAKKTEQVLVKQSVSKGMERDELKGSISKLGQRVSEKTKELKEVIELEKGMLEQKVQKIWTFYEQKFESLIEMVQQVARRQQKMLNSQRDSTLSKIDLESSQQIPSLNKRCMGVSESKYRAPFSEKGGNQSKSKISYYLSKSNFNDTTTLGDTSINHLSGIGTAANY